MNILRDLARLSMALIAAALTWWIADMLSGHPRPLDFYIFFSVELCGATILFHRNGWFK